MVTGVGRFYLVADRLGWHRPVHRSEMSFDCVHAAGGGEVMDWTSVLDTAQHANLVQQWMLRGGDLPLSDEWIPSEWLLRAWDTPAMAAAECKDLSTRTRLFEIDADPVLLARSIPVVVRDLGLAGVDRFRVVREVPNWWLLGPGGREVLAFLHQFEPSNLAPQDGFPSLRPELADLRLQALAVVDAAKRVGGYALASAVIDGHNGRPQDHRQMALVAAIGYLIKDVWPEAPRLYEPWVRHYGLPDLSVTIREDDLPYPVALGL